MKRVNSKIRSRWESVRSQRLNVVLCLVAIASPPGQDWEQLLLRDGVRGGSNARNLIKLTGRLDIKLALEIARQVAAGLGNSRTESCPPRYQASKHHGEVEGRRSGSSKDYRPWFGEDTRRINF